MLVNLAKSWFTKAMPEIWLFFLGFLFVVVTLFLPDGVVGLWAKLRPRRAVQRPPAKPAEEPGRAAEEATA